MAKALIPKVEPVVALNVLKAAFAKKEHLSLLHVITLTGAELEASGTNDQHIMRPYSTQIYLLITLSSNIRIVGYIFFYLI